jgi:CDP-glucose 4,6-dehydratase
MREDFNGAFSGRRIMVTGHTGFKGSWLSIWLRELGARVTGFSLDPPTVLSNFELSRLGGRMTDLRGDIRQIETFREALAAHQPELVFHMAAQTVVGRSLRDPAETFSTNTQGTVHVLETVRTAPGRPVRALLFVSSDKCYENRPWRRAYREGDRLGGADPYSASKAMSELAVAVYEQSFFAKGGAAEDGPALASARSGNVLGGGDYAEFRIVPDCITALAAGRPVAVRNPQSVRPWQFILDSLCGYLCLAARLLEEGAAFSGPWNFGPLEEEGIRVQQIVEKTIDLWGTGSWRQAEPPGHFVESDRVQLCRVKAASLLGWRPLYTWQEALEETVSWYKTCLERKKETDRVDMYDVCAGQIHRFNEKAFEQGFFRTASGKH